MRGINYTEVLRKTINHLKENWFKKNTGIVAATLIENELAVSATSRYLPDENKWLHAEAAVIKDFRKLFGKSPAQSSTIVVTLSPCIQESNSRLGISCSHKILSLGITQVKFGFLDIKQAGDVSIYRKIGLDAIIAGDQKSQQVCQSLYQLFDKLYDQNGRFYYLLGSYSNPWQEIKRQIELEPFYDLK